LSNLFYDVQENGANPSDIGELSDKCVKLAADITRILLSAGPENSIADVKAKLLETQEKLKTTEDVVGSLTTIKASLESKIAMKESDSATVVDELERMKEELAAALVDNITLKALSSADNKELSALERKVEDAQATIAQLTSELGVLNNQQDQTNAALTTAQELLGEFKYQVGSLETQVQDLTTKNAELESQLATKVDELAGLQSSEADLKDQLEQLMCRHENLEQELSSTQAESRKTKDENYGLKRRLEKTQEKSQELENKLGSVTKAHDQAVDDRDHIVSAMHFSQREQQKAEEQAKSYRNKSDSLVEESSRLSVECSRLSGEKSELEAKLKQAETKLASLKTKPQDLEAKMKSLALDLELEKEAFNRYKAHHTRSLEKHALDSQVTGVHNDDIYLQTLNQLDEAYTSTIQEKAEMSSALSSIQSQLDVLKTKNARLETKLTNNERGMFWLYSFYLDRA